MAALFKIALLVLSLVILIKAQGSSNQANLQSITQGMQGMPNLQGMAGNIPGVPGGSQGLPGGFPGMSSIPGFGSFSSTPQVREDMMHLMTDPCTFKTLQSLAKLSSDMRAAKENEGEKKKD